MDKRIFAGYSYKASRRGAIDEYPYLLFLQKKKEKNILQFDLNMSIVDILATTRLYPIALSFLCHLHRWKSSIIHYKWLLLEILKVNLAF